ncbi:unannotated protein [freshwater metagenome]|uniref:Unannotated protein n=1 Tax=freshwater metagenome TaxID=449393 RepID=A0A6J7JIB2_9ZZZZ
MECTTAAQRTLFDAYAGTTTASREAMIAERNTAEALDALAGQSVPAVRADGIEHGHFMLEDEHCRAVGASVETAQPDMPPFWRAGPAVRFSAAQTQLAPSPDNGQQTAAVLRDLGHDDGFIAKLDELGVTRPVGNGLPT